jgi:Brp/Blh family beta-carotene 15,15'-monooxygenase
MAPAIMLDMPSLIALFFVVLIGLPHGAFDGAVAVYLGVGRTVRSLLVFCIGYCLLAAVVVLLWIQFPAAMLIVFLLISAIHFGWGDATSISGAGFAIQVVIHGTLPVFGIAVFHADEVQSLFNLISDGGAAPALFLAQLICWLVAGLLPVYVVFAWRDRSMRRRFIEGLGLAVTLALLPPLVGFALYFCLFHTARHMAHIWQNLTTVMPLRQVYWQAAIFTLSSWGAGVLVLVWLDSGDITADLMRVIFIGLAALTVPHMILVDGWFRGSESKNKHGKEV